MEMKEKIKQLREALHEHNYLYYILDAPKITDFEFDQMLKALQDLERKYPEFFDPNSPTQRVGGGVTKNFKTQVHRYPCTLFPIPIPKRNYYYGWVEWKRYWGTKNLNLRVN